MDLSIFGMFEEPVRYFLMAAVGGAALLACVFVGAMIVAAIVGGLGALIGLAALDTDAIVAEALAEEEAKNTQKLGSPRPRVRDLEV